MLNSHIRVIYVRYSDKRQNPERAYKIFKANNYQEFDFAGISHPIIKLPIAKSLIVWYWILDFWMYALFILGPPVFALAFF